MQVEIHKSESNDQISLNLMITLAKEYGDIVEQEINDSQEPNNEITEQDYNVDANIDEIEPEIPILEKLVTLLPPLLVVGDKKEKTDNFMLNFIEEIPLMTPSNVVTVLDPRNDTLYQNSSIFISRIITDMVDCFGFLEEAAQKTFNPDIPTNYIIINQCIDMFFANCNKFIELLKLIMKNLNYRLILVTNESGLLTDTLLKIMQNRVIFWCGSIRTSKLLLGNDCACIPYEWSFIFSDDYGESYGVFSLETTKEDELL